MYCPEVSSSSWMATPRMPLMVRKRRVMMTRMVTSLLTLCFSLLWAASCSSEPPKKLQVKKHSLAAQTQDWNY